MADVVELNVSHARVNRLQMNRISPREWDFRKEKESFVTTQSTIITVIATVTVGGVK